MRRRLNILIVAATATALVAIGPSVRTAAADSPPSERELDPPVPATPGPGAASTPAPVDPPPAELPADFLAPSPSPSPPPPNLGPPPTPNPAPSTAVAPPGRGTTPPTLKNLFKAAPRPGKPPVTAAATPTKPAATDPLDDTPPDVGAAPALPAPGGVALPPPGRLPAPPDDEVERTQAVGTAPAHGSARPPAPAGDVLPPAAERPGLPAATNPGGLPRDPETPFVIAPDKLPVGLQTIGLTVQVIAPQFLNVNQTAALKVVVKNTGTTDARGVVVRDVLPPNFQYVGSQPEATPKGDVLTWNLGDVPAGSERPITLTVKPTAVGGFDHTATVTMAAGARSRTVVREPKLKVELSANSGKVLLGQPVSFKIAVTNPGDGPARNVAVQAKLSPGLRHESGEPNADNLFEQTIAVISPGETVTLDTLVADTVLGNEQSCTVAARSADAPADRAEAKVTVVEPKLTVKVAGPKDRYTDTLAAYEVVLENPGTAAAKNVKVVATVPVSARLQNPLPPGARFNTQTRKLTWSRPQIDAGEKVSLPFQVRVGGVGLYSLSAEAKCDGVAPAKDVFQTDVTGLADVTFDVTEKRRVVDVDGETTFVIKVVNSGTKEATGLLLSADLSKNVEAVGVIGPDVEAKTSEDKHQVKFAEIPRLGPNRSMELGIKVKATGQGLGTCRVSLLHNELPEKLDDIAAFKVMPSTRR